MKIFFAQQVLGLSENLTFSSFSPFFLFKISCFCWNEDYVRVRVNGVLFVERSIIILYCCVIFKTCRFLIFSRQKRVARQKLINCWKSWALLRMQGYAYAENKTEPIGEFYSQHNFDGDILPVLMQCCLDFVAYFVHHHYTTPKHYKMQKNNADWPIRIYQRAHLIKKLSLFS